jgi:hypothetical protein
MQQILGSNECDFEIHCKLHGMGYVYSKNFVTVTIITGRLNVMKVTDVQTPPFK